jgi:hydrogenase maturation protein HypF
VGFRPHVYRLARARGLAGFVLNSIQGVLIEAEGAATGLDAFVEELRAGPPPNAVVTGFTTEAIPDEGTASFTVRHSDATGEPAAFLLPDLAICPECLADITNPCNRRYRYPFTTCTHCGPRYSIVEGIPYDRPLTSMRHFPMCPACQAEYVDPLDRRFHAQTNCCAECGPQLALWDSAGSVLSAGDAALRQAVAAVRAGRILALKGIGGFHLICDALNGEAIRLLRTRKQRPAKPLAVMARQWELADREERLLQSPQAPIVLVERPIALPEEIAPGNPFLGVMRPYSPLHALLLDSLDGPIVATSGNLTDEPICIDEHEALARLGKVADLFLVHNRPILRPVDDSIVRWMDGAPTLLRRARGYAPLPLQVVLPLPQMVATGAHMKNTVAVSRGRLIFLSQHLGDLSTVAALEGHRQCLRDLTGVYQIQPEKAVCDLHPDYGSTASARALGLPLRAVQHHEAHVLAGIAEHAIEGPVLGVAWDGSGYGTDGTVWGGEYLQFAGGVFTRVDHLRTFRLPGGEQAVRQPRRSLLGVSSEMGRPEWARPLFQEAEWRVLQVMLERRLNAPLTSSMGRLFDAAAALLGLCPVSSFEGEAAMQLEFAARESSCHDTVPMETDWAELMLALAESNRTVADRAAMFHNAIADSVVRIAERHGLHQVLLTGGCFQNALLVERTAGRLRAAGFKVFTHRALPPNDGAIAVGQIVAAALGG